jgi:tetratricopeptide (TPR) repeat protein
MIASVVIGMMMLLRGGATLHSGAANLAPGDEAFRRIDYPAAIAAYEEEYVRCPNEAEVLWRLARVYVCAGEVKEGEDAERDFRRAEQYARRCIELDSASVEGHTWLAASLGYQALHAGVVEKIELTSEMHRVLDRVLSLDPQNDAAYSMRGSYFRAFANASWLERRLAVVLFPSLPEGGYEEAEAALKKAIALAPDVMRHHYELGILYLDWGRIADAKAALEHAATLPIRVAIDVPRLAKIQKLLASLAYTREHE